MNTNHKLGSVRELALFGRLLRGSLIATAVFALAFVVAPYIIAEANATTNVGGHITWSAIDLTLDPDVAASEDYETSGGTEGSPIDGEGHGNVDFGNIVPTAKNTTDGDYGTLKVEKKTIGVTTRGKYYSVYLSMVGAERGLTLDGLESTSMKISATSGTWDAPKTLAQNGASGWGYMVPATPIKQSDGETASVFSFITTETAVNTFDSQLDTQLYRRNGAAYTTSVWAGVPALSTPQQIWKNTAGVGNEKTDFSDGETFAVYYAINVDNDVMAGVYENQIVYTAIASAQSLDSVSTNLARTVKFGAGGTEQTIHFDLAQAVGGIINESNIKVKLVPHDVMATANFNPANLTAQQKQDAIDCPIVQGSFTTTTVQQAEQTGSLSTVRCTMPTGIAADESNATLWDGAYEYWVEVDGYGYNYVSKVENGNEPGFVYVGLQSVDNSGNKYVKTMQDMSAGVCQNTYQWDNGLGSKAKLWDMNNIDSTTHEVTPLDITSRATVGSWNGENTEFTPSTTADGVGSFALKDARDGKKYVVRRLADGNCWMAQNLNLDLYTGMTLTSDDTDINEERGSWVIADAENSNNEKTIGAYGNLAWVTDAGSTSKAWQTAHGVEMVTLKRYNYVEQIDDETGLPNGTFEWEATTVATCSGGTAQQPCFATRSDLTSNGGTQVYYKIADATDVSKGRAANVGDEYVVTAAYALADGYKQNDTTGSPVRGFAAGKYYTKATYVVRKMNAANTGNGDTYTTTNLGESCSYSYFNDKLKTDTACVIETSGPAMITQFSNDGSGVGLSTTEVSRVAITKDHLGNTIDFMNNTSAKSTIDAFNDANWSQYPMAGSGADYRWQLNGRDGAHVLDAGPLIFSTNVTDDGNGNYTLKSGGGSGTKCTNVATVQGTLTLNGNLLSFVSCMDGSGQSAEAMADTRLDGNWYNWYAAVAGSAYPANTSTPAQDSICPKGWRLPTDNEGFDKNNNPSVSSFYSLITTNVGDSPKIKSSKSYQIGNNMDGNQTNDTKIQAFPLSFLRSGYYSWGNAGLLDRGSSGYYWSSGSYSDGASRYLYFYASYLNPRYSNGKGYGFAVRCVAAQ